jgi:RNA polymerase sigma-70 factor (ECF subfamily)
MGTATSVAIQEWQSATVSPAAAAWHTACAHQKGPNGMQPGEQAATADVTGLLQVWSDGDERAFDRLIPLVYGELHRMAHRYLARERADLSMQPTGLVNEVCLRLLGWDPVRWQNRGHFFGVSAQMMRRVLVDIARRRGTGRRGAGVVHVPVEDVEVPDERPDSDLVALDGALEELAARDARKAQVVELKFFGGLSMEEIAEALGVSLRTVHNDWAFARAWLYRSLAGGSDSP